ncbi:MAG TPA: hypothetical protein VN776_06725 [Terracidiphilus sp.]|nr:hypothetical protein [Terracidiphilus sp.]
MVVVPLTQPEKEAKTQRRSCGAECTNWVRFAAGGSLLAGGLLLLTGNRKAGLCTAASGTALAILDQQEAVKAWWDALPAYIDNVQNLLGKVEESVREFENQRARLQKILSK